MMGWFFVSHGVLILWCLALTWRLLRLEQWLRNESWANLELRLDKLEDAKPRLRMEQSNGAEKVSKEYAETRK